MIIGFTGKMGSGKTTAKDEAISMLASHEVRSFAAPLKEMMRAYYRSVGLQDHGIEERIAGKFKEKHDPHLMGKTARHAMQTLGTDWGRNMIHPDLWVEAAFMKPETASNLIFDDVRFPNEASAIRKRGGIIIRIVRENDDHTGVIHASERQEFDADYVIGNRGTVKQLKAMLRAILHDAGVATTS